MALEDRDSCARYDIPALFLRMVLAAFTVCKPCRRKTNRPPSAEALALARPLAPHALIDGYAR
jgi:hypothetical protein